MGVRRGGPQTDKTPATKSFTGQFFSITAFGIAFYHAVESFYDFLSLKRQQKGVGLSSVICRSTVDNLGKRGRKEGRGGGKDCWRNAKLWRGERWEYAGCVT
jgi:hypothetical protein